MDDREPVLVLGQEEPPIAGYDGHRGTNFLGMDGPTLLAACRDDHTAWAEAFCQVAVHRGYSDMDRGWVELWFANAMMTTLDIERGARPVVLPDGSAFFIAEAPV